MHRIVLCLFFAFFLAGCGNYWPYSRDIWIDDRVTEEEERFILEAMNEWEEETGENLFEYRGRISDREYRYGRSDFFDTKNVIYVINEPTMINGRLICDHEFGKCQGEDDIFICRENLVDYHEGESDSQIRSRLKGVTTHELGHFIRLEHNDNIGSIMYRANALGRDVQFEDIEQFQRVKKKKERMCLFFIFLSIGFILTVVEFVLRHII